MRRFSGQLDAPIQVHERSLPGIHARQRSSSKISAQSRPRRPGRTGCERDYGATTALIVNSSEPRARGVTVRRSRGFGKYHRRERSNQSRTARTDH